MWRRVFEAARYCLVSRHANVTAIFSVCGAILAMAVGFTVDFGYAVNINQRLNQAADTAVLAAVSVTAADASGGFANAISGGHFYAYGMQSWSVNTAGLPIQVTPNLSVVANSSGGATATLTYSASVPTYFAGLIGINSIPISGTATATSKPLTYIRYYILVDISQSMGIGATTTDMQNLYNRVVQYGQGTGGESGCVFGCHVAESTQTYSNEYLAHNISPYITLRIDSASSAIDSIISSAISAENSTSPNIAIGLYTMSDYPSATVTQVFAPTTNLSSHTSVSVSLGSNTSSGIGDTDFTDQITNFTTNYLSAQGTGASSSSPLNYVFLITDGLSDVSCTSGTTGYYYGHCAAAFSSSLCQQMKAKATVGVIYTTYLPIYANNTSSNGYETSYTHLVAPYVSSIPGNLQACASSSAYYYEASDGPSISTAMQTIFQNSEQFARLTQ